MNTKVRCDNCKDTRLKPTHTKGFFECRSCGAVTDARGIGSYVAKGIGTTVGVVLGVATLGLIPDEAQAAVEEFFENLFS